MCGLSFSIYPVTSSVSSSDVEKLPLDPIELFDSLAAANFARGPDTQSTYTTRWTVPGGEVELKLNASVLGLRGGVVAQPLTGERGVLGWNGQVFDGLDLGLEDNDTQRVFAELERGADPLELLSRLEGPYAFIYCDLREGKVYFQLDPLSRRSLLVHPPMSSLAAVGNVENDKECVSQFWLSSTRSSLAREHEVEMRALLGGEGGVIDLNQIRLGAEGLDMSSALSVYTTLPASSSGGFTSLKPINRSLPEALPPRPSPDQVQTFIGQLTRSVKRRTENVPQVSAGQSRIAVLFSGGVDCTLLAAILHRCLPEDEPIDLINVAFSPQVKAPSSHQNSVSSQATYMTPDRISGLDAWEELGWFCPREWRFVEVNVTYEECQEHRQRVVDLMYPSLTEMDLSLAFPLYFASRGYGHIRPRRRNPHETSNDTDIDAAEDLEPCSVAHTANADDAELEEYNVTAKVYLSGLGADEQLGGYARHRQAFRRGWQGLIDEMDIDRLPTRNLSRDDRILSSHARDARYPYLDLSFVSYLSGLPIWTKCDPTHPEGHGDKFLLRLAAAAVGLERSSKRVKRAMQFGTRSSKMSGGKGPRAGERRID